MRSLVRGNVNAAPGCVRHVRILGKPGLRIGSGSRRGAASERASIAGRVLGGVAVAPMTRGLQGVLICRWGTAFDSREGGGLGRPPWAVRLGELWQRSPCLCNGGLVCECHRDRHLDGHLGCHWSPICSHSARSTAPASRSARFPTSGEESELRESLRTHSCTFGAAGLSARTRSQRPHCGDDTRRTSRLGSTRGGRLRRRRAKGCHPGAMIPRPRTKKSDLTECFS